MLFTQALFNYNEESKKSGEPPKKLTVSFLFIITVGAYLIISNTFPAILPWADRSSKPPRRSYTPHIYPRLP